MSEPIVPQVRAFVRLKKDCGVPSRVYAATVHFRGLTLVPYWVLQHAISVPSGQFLRLK